VPQTNLDHILSSMQTDENLSSLVDSIRDMSLRARGTKKKKNSSNKNDSNKSKPPNNRKAGKKYGSKTSDHKCESAPKQKHMSFAQFKGKRDALLKEYYAEFNHNVFDNKLPADMKLEWNVRLNKTAGCTYMKVCVCIGHG
jgi:hypothetical protein